MGGRPAKLLKNLYINRLRLILLIALGYHEQREYFWKIILICIINIENLFLKF
jgi:hypothetical protein